MENKCISHLPLEKGEGAQASQGRRNAFLAIKNGQDWTFNGTDGSCDSL